MNDFDEAGVRNLLAMQSLMKQLEALQNELKANRGVADDTNDLLIQYTKVLKDVSNGAGYDDLTTEQKTALSEINELLPKINKVIHKAESDKYNEARKSFEDPDPKVMDSLAKVTSAVIKTSAYLKVYLKGSKSKSAPRVKGLGNKEDTAERNLQATEAQGYIKDATEPLVSRMRQFSASFQVKPKTIAKPKAEEEGSTDGMTSKLDYLAKGITIFGTALSGFNNAVGQFIGALGSAYSAVAQGFGDMLDDPLSGVISAMNGMSSMITASMGFFTSILETISGIFTSIFSGGDDDKEGGSSSKITAIATAILSIISSILNAALQSIQAGLQIFTSTLQAVFKLVKKIAFTSPVIKAILELLNLAFTLFFMPFMNSFALVLLPYVLELLDWAVTNGAQYAEWGQVLGESLANLLTTDGGILEQVKELAISFITDFLPSFLALLPELITFAVAFVSDILNNKNDIIRFLNSGFQAFSAMLEAGILSDFLEFGKKTMQWLGNNAPQLVTFIASVMEGMLRIARFFAGFTGGTDEISDVDIESITSKATALTDAMKQFQTTDVTQQNQNQGNSLTPTVPTAALGGKFPYNGGIPVLTGEGGEGEYKLSETELKEIGKDTTVSIQYNGQILSKYDFKETVRKALTDVSSKSYYR